MPLMPVGEVQLFYQLTDFTEPWKLGARPLVFIHGLGGNHSFWLYQARELCRRYPILTLDLRGHGSSTVTDDNFSIEDMVRDVARLLRNLGVENAHIVGLSLGGMVAAQFALDYPYATASLVLADTYCGAPPGSEQVMAEALQFIEENAMAEVARARITNAFSERIGLAVRDYCIAQVAANDKQTYVRAARAAFRFSVRERLGEIDAPTLVIVGEEDRVTPPPLSEEMAALIPHATLHRIPAAGHITNIERPDEFNQAVIDFLATVPDLNARSTGNER